MKLKLEPKKEEILSLYESGLNSEQISKLLGEYPQAIVNLLKRYKVYKDFRPKQGNVRYFQTIDSFNKAYFLGFIAADGCLQYFHKTSKGLSITLDIKDKIILEKLKEEIGNEHEIRVWSKPNNYNKTISTFCRFQLANSFLYEDIVSYGITPKKSLTLKNVLDKIPKSFRKAFIIGYFDGDGSVYKQNNLKTKQTSKGLKQYKAKGLSINIRGTEEFLSPFPEEIGITHYKICKYDSTYQLIFSKRTEILKFFQCYSSCDFYLPRKHNIFLERIDKVQTISPS